VAQIDLLKIGHLSVPLNLSKIAKNMDILRIIFSVLLAFWKPVTLALAIVLMTIAGFNFVSKLDRMAKSAQCFQTMGEDAENIMNCTQKYENAEMEAVRAGQNLVDKSDNVDTAGHLLAKE
jgi:hypothetical protein